MKKEIEDKEMKKSSFEEKRKVFLEDWSLKRTVVKKINKNQNL